MDLTKTLKMTHIKKKPQHFVFWYNTKKCSHCVLKDTHGGKSFSSGRCAHVLSRVQLFGTP